MPEPAPATGKIDVSRLSPLYPPHAEPTRHRRPAAREGAPAEVVNTRRPTPLTVAARLRGEVGAWRDLEYPDVSDTTRQLLGHWFGGEHRVGGAGSGGRPFRYHWCQREAVETWIFLTEYARVRNLTELLDKFDWLDRDDREAATERALGVNAAEDRWPRFAFKLATGAGKTKVMSLCIAYSYFHALREGGPDGAGSPLARNFLIVAPGITVFERLREDFGGGRIFREDPVIPPEWAGDFNLDVVLQNESGGAAAEGVLYLTNIHQLYPAPKRGGKGEAETHGWAGPAVSKATALDTAERLRERIGSHRRLLVCNDEAHHVWDPKSTWNDCLNALHEATAARGGPGGGLAAQLDFSATPKDNRGRPFPHTVVDTPLGEAVDGGIVKAPVVGVGEGLTERQTADPADRFEAHLTLGYAQWEKSCEEWAGSGKHPILFVMCASTNEADAIARRLDTSPAYAGLNGRTVNLHTNLKGKVVGGVFKEAKQGSGKTQISDGDLEALRKISRDLDRDDSPYRCVVSVMMLREGWDVKNVTVIVPLRRYTADSGILVEQTLGRGLRRMTGPGEDVTEIVRVVEHEKFAEFYRKQLGEEGVDAAIAPAEDVPRTTATIYVDRDRKDVETLDIVVPGLSAGVSRAAKLGDLDFDGVLRAAKAVPPLDPGGPGPKTELEYTEKLLLTGEVLGRSKVRLKLLEVPGGAVTFFREEVEAACGLSGTHAALAPLIERFLAERAFGEAVNLYDANVVARLQDRDVREAVRAAFLPAVWAATVRSETPAKTAGGGPVSDWPPYQVTVSEDRPTAEAARTAFNLVPCHRGYEKRFAARLDEWNGVAAFCKNAGPAAVRIDYRNRSGRPASYTPDFLIRTGRGGHYLAETKGRTDRDVPAKARAAAVWCAAASGGTRDGAKAPAAVAGQNKWAYLFVPQDVFERAADAATIDDFAKACAPGLAELLTETTDAQARLPFADPDADRSARNLAAVLPDGATLPPRAKKAVGEAVDTLHYSVGRGFDLAKAFQVLLSVTDDTAAALLVARLRPRLPPSERQAAFFEPDLSTVGRGGRGLAPKGFALKKLLTGNAKVTPIGTLSFCLEHAAGDGREAAGGVFAAVREAFADLAGTPLARRVGAVGEFRNTYVAHQERGLTDPRAAEMQLREWSAVLVDLHAALRA